MPRTYHRQAVTDTLPNGKMQSIFGGPVNCLPFDEDSSLYLPQRLVHAEADNQGGGIVRHRGGAYGYDVNLNRGSVKVYPVRGSWSKYIEIFDPVPPDAFKDNQLAPDAVEYYIDYPGYRYSFIVNDQGFKTLITVDESYTGSGDFTLGFRTVGLTIDGRDIKDGDTVIMTLSDAWLMDSSEGIPNIRTVGEIYHADKVTITADLTGLTFPVLIDPSLGPINPNADTMLFSQAPTTNYGSNILTQIWQDGNTLNANRTAMRFDISSIPAGSTIDSAILTWIVTITSGANILIDFNLFDVGKENWPELQTSWTNFDNSGPTPWTTPGGDFGAAYVSHNKPTGTGAYNTEHKAGAQVALDSYAGIFSFIGKFQNEALPGTVSFFNMHSNNAVVPANRPTLTVTYTEPSAAAIPPHVFARVR